jgi:hypothetical protein
MCHDSLIVHKSVRNRYEVRHVVMVGSKRAFGDATGRAEKSALSNGRASEAFEVTGVIGYIYTEVISLRFNF